MSNEKKKKNRFLKKMKILKLEIFSLTKIEILKSQRNKIYLIGSDHNSSITSYWLKIGNLEWLEYYEPKDWIFVAGYQAVWILKSSNLELVKKMNLAHENCIFLPKLLNN